MNRLTPPTRSHTDNKLLAGKRTKPGDHLNERLDQYFDKVGIDIAPRPKSP